MADHQINSLNNGTGITGNKSPNSQYPIPLSDVEQKILVIAKETAQKHSRLNIEELLTQAVRLLPGYTHYAIEEGIDGLYRKKILFEGSTLTRDTVLNNNMRRAIFDLVRTRPGIHFSAIRKAIEVDSRSVMVHLRVLVRFELVRAETYDNNKVYFDFNLPKKDDLFYYHLRKGKVREIYTVVLSQPGISLSALASALQDVIPRATLYRKVKMLIESNFLEGIVESGQILGLSVPGRLILLLSSTG